MIKKNLKNQNIAIVVCGHGSRSELFLKSFSRVFKNLEKHFINYYLFSSFLEKNKPNIKECFKKIKKFKYILFIPFFLFKGKHYENDIKSQIQFNKQYHKKIIVCDFGLGKKIARLNSEQINGIIKPYNKKLLVSISSYSKYNVVRTRLYYYTNILSKMCSVEENIIADSGQDKELFLKIRDKLNNGYEIIIHPVFLLNGYLYSSLKNKFLIELNENILITEPFLNNENILKYLIKKIESLIKAL